jgi:hypothetical protein
VATNTAQQRIRDFVDDVARKLEAMEASERSAREVTRSRLDVILRKCGYQNVSRTALERIQAMLIESGIYPEPGLTEAGLQRNQLIYFGRRVPTAAARPREQMFTEERDLERYIVANFKHLAPFRNLELIKNQYEIPGLQRLDLLARDRLNGDYVLIELKRDDANHALIGQLSVYVDAIRARAREMNPGQEPRVKVVVVTGQPNVALKTHLEQQVLRGRASLEWYVYEVNLVLQPV